MCIGEGIGAAGLTEPLADRRTGPVLPVQEELRSLVRLSVPIAIAQLGLVSMSLVDTAVIGRVSVDDLAGAGMGRATGFAAIIVGVGVTTALEPMAAQAIGAGDPGKAWRSYVANLRGALLLWAPAIVAAFAVTLSLPVLGVEAAVVSRVRLYLLGQAPGFGLMLAFLSSKTFLQAHGRTGPALAGSIVANVINLFVSNLLVRGDGALRAVGLAVGLKALGALGGDRVQRVLPRAPRVRQRRTALSYRARDPGPPVPLRDVYRLGIPVGLQMLAEVGIFSLVALLSGALGPEVASAHQVAIGLASFTFMGALGVGATAVPGVGHAVSAGTCTAPGLRHRPRRRRDDRGRRCFHRRAPRARQRLHPRRARHHHRRRSPPHRGGNSSSASRPWPPGPCAARATCASPSWPTCSGTGSWASPVALTLGFALHHGAARGLWWGLTCGLVVVSVALLR